MGKRARIWAGARIGVLAAMLAALAACGRAEEGPDYRGWPAYGGGHAQIKYSALDQINAVNVGQLEVAWTYETGEDSTLGTMHSTPLLQGGVLYLAGPTGSVHAIDPATGERLWRTDVSHPDGTNPHFRGAPRGLMYWSEGEAARIFTLAGRYVIAIDAKSGAVAEEFGEGGHVDLRVGLGRDPAMLETELSSPGVVYRDLLIVGSRAADVQPSSPGFVRAYDVRTGALRWTFHTIPQPGEFGYETWPEDAWTYAGGANSWAGMALDETRGLVIFGTGSAASDFYGADRIGDNLFANCIIALNAETGERVWHQQVVRHDLWDRDLPAPPSLATIRRNGERVDVVIQTTKSGHIWVLDRETGAPLFPIEEIAAPASDVPGEQAAPRQRVPLLPEPFARQSFNEEELTTRTPASNAAVRAAIAGMDSSEEFTPPSVRGRVLFPGFDGGGEWGGGAFDPETGLFYVNANEMPWILKLVEVNQSGALRRASDVYRSYCAGCHGADRAGTDNFPALTDIGSRADAGSVASLIAEGGGRMPAFAGALPSDVIAALSDYLVDGRDARIDARGIEPQLYATRFRNDGWPRFVDPDGYPAVRPPWGTLTAIDMSTGQHVWRRPLGEYPELVAQGLADTGSENYGGPVVTAGGVLFIGATLYDRKIRAFDKANGALLWEYELPAAGVATPAVYEVEGRQFVVIAAGGPRGGPRGASYVAFALPN